MIQLFAETQHYVPQPSCQWIVWTPANPPCLSVLAKPDTSTNSPWFYAFFCMQIFKYVNALAVNIAEVVLFMSACMHGLRMLPVFFCMLSIAFLNPNAPLRGCNGVKRGVGSCRARSAGVYVSSRCLLSGLLHIHLG